ASTSCLTLPLHAALPICPSSGQAENGRLELHQGRVEWSTNCGICFSREVFNGPGRLPSTQKGTPSRIRRVCIRRRFAWRQRSTRSEEHTSELQSREISYA